MRIWFTPSAKQQFLEALAYIRRDKPSAAYKFKDKAERVLRRLTAFPDSGRLIPEYPDFPHREVIVKPYRFFYRIKKKTIWIVAVWHSAQLPKGPSP